MRIVFLVVRSNEDGEVVHKFIQEVKEEGSEFFDDLKRRNPIFSPLLNVISDIYYLVCAILLWLRFSTALLISIFQAMGSCKSHHWLSSSALD